MDQSTAVWFVIGLAIVTANLPFLIERPLLAVPWEHAGEPARARWMRGLESLVFFVLLVALGYATRPLIGSATFSGGDQASVLLFLVKLVAVLGGAAALLSYPGWRLRGAPVAKPFFERLLELLVFYGLVGALGFGFEANIGNPFPQSWQFYVVSLCLFVVLGYPGFVYRYLMRRRALIKMPGRSAVVQRPAGSSAGQAASTGQAQAHSRAASAVNPPAGSAAAPVPRAASHRG
ncbi:MAG: DUF2818 family protein [Candidimonas sp.]|nr:MAG: DUF2818 family protein [Candidimonas sp.]